MDANEILRMVEDLTSSGVPLVTCSLPVTVNTADELAAFDEYGIRKYGRFIRSPHPTMEQHIALIGQWVFVCGTVRQGAVHRVRVGVGIEFIQKDAPVHRPHLSQQPFSPN